MNTTKFKEKFKSISDLKYKFSQTGYIKPIGTTALITVFGWLLYEVYATINTLKIIGKIDTINRGVKYITIDEKLTKGVILGTEGYLDHHLGWHRLTSWLNHINYQFYWRLLNLAQSDDKFLRTTALQKLVNASPLSESDLIQLAQACDLHTAVGMARHPNVNHGYFLPPPSLYKTSGKKGLLNDLRDILFKLNQHHNHICVKYFLSKAFPEFEKRDNYLLDAEVMLTEPWQILITQENLLPLCVQALDHHISTVANEKLLVELGGLPLLMAVYLHHKEDINVSKMICRILARVCTHPEYLPQIFESGWIGVMAEWLNSDDLLLNLLAGQCLINLDRDEPSQIHYGRHVVPLYPTHRTQTPSTDVIFVHGLLGGVLSTWRQRVQYRRSLTMALHKDDLNVDTRHRQRSSDTHTEEYLAAVNEFTLAEWEQLGADYEFVVSDFPVSYKASKESDKLLTLSGEDPNVRQCGTDSSCSVCWPKDWLPKDCSSIRVLGIDYESRISEWFPSCSEKLRTKSLKERASVVLSELKRCAVGSRPTVWVAHSMGGLLVKKILIEAAQSSDYDTRKIAYNTKAIVFLSTPHLGCPLAKMNDILNYVLWPSTEVEELRHNSEVLNKLHQEFQTLLSSVNIRIVTFAEAKSTRTLGVELHIVPPEFSYIDVGEVFEMPCDHACVAKPCNKLSFIYQTVLNVIRKVTEESPN